MVAPVIQRKSTKFR